ncbi:MAG: glycosyltransferase family 2 protein [Acidobacteriia bacterium]|nr:glycosyltransferase family 2 protein [Terriglobia bacterium]
MSGPEISLVIPSWNGKALLEEHLASVVEGAAGISGSEVIVSDDGSTDGTIEAIARRFPRVRAARRDRNGGFGPAANDGVAAASGRLVILLNNDVAVPPGTFERLAEALEAAPEAFAAVPSIVRRESGEDEARTRIRFRWGVVSTSVGGGLAVDPAYACGGAMAFRRAEFLALGGFDPLFAPFYWEDVDLSYRARKRGRRIVLVDGARVEHDHGRTIGARFEPRSVVGIYERNRLIFTWKNLGDSALMRRHLAFLPLKLAWDLAAHPAFVRGFRAAWALRPALAPLRRRERAEATNRDRELLARPR